MGWGLGDVVSKTEPPKEAKWRVREKGSSRTSHPKDQQTGSGLPGLQRACCFPSEYSHKTVRCNNIENMFKQIRTFIFTCVCKCLVTKEYFPLQPLWAVLFFFKSTLEFPTRAGGLFLFYRDLTPCFQSRCCENRADISYASETLMMPRAFIFFYTLTMENMVSLCTT